MDGTRGKRRSGRACEFTSVKYARCLKIRFGGRGSGEGRAFGFPKPDPSSLALYGPLTALLIRCRESAVRLRGMYDLESCQPSRIRMEKSIDSGSLSAMTWSV